MLMIPDGCCLLWKTALPRSEWLQHPNSRPGFQDLSRGTLVVVKVSNVFECMGSAFTFWRLEVQLAKLCKSFSLRNQQKVIQVVIQKWYNSQQRYRMCFEDILTLYEVQVWINLIKFGMLLSICFAPATCSCLLSWVCRVTGCKHLPDTSRYSRSNSVQSLATLFPHLPLYRIGLPASETSTRAVNSEH